MIDDQEAEGAPTSAVAGSGRNSPPKNDRKDEEFDKDDAYDGDQHPTEDQEDKVGTV